MADTPLPAGSRVGKFEIIDHVATGGMGAVYKAWDTVDHRLVALKILPSHLAERPVLLERFRREARTVSRLVHKNIVAVYEYGEDQNHHFLAMEFIDGIDLDELIRRRTRLSPNEALAVMAQALRALDYAFRSGVTHRDIKPGNFLLARGSDKVIVKLLDFGLARADREEDYRLTRAGATVGTVDYLSPEQARDSASADVRSDIYSLGCTLYHMLTGQPPFPEGGLAERIHKHLYVDPTDVRVFNAEVSEDLNTVVMRMLAKSPSDRYQTPSELLHVIGRLRRGEPLRPSISAEAAEIGGVVGHGDADSEVALGESTSGSGDSSPSSTGLYRRRVVDDDPATLGLTPAERKTAADDFERVKTLVKSGRKDEALTLLLECCKRDPTALIYRRTLRKLDKPKRGSWLGGMALQAKFKAAKLAGDDRRLLDIGEEILLAQTDAVSVQADMVEAALRLGLLQLALWMAEKVYQIAPDDAGIQRLVARVYERHGYFVQAIGLWETLRRANPDDTEAVRKITALTANLSIAKGNYQSG